MHSQSQTTELFAVKHTSGSGQSAINDMSITLEAEPVIPQSFIPSSPALPLECFANLQAQFSNNVAGSKPVTGSVGTSNPPAHHRDYHAGICQQQRQ